MSEWCVNAYYVNSDAITKSIGSKSEDLLKMVLKDKGGVIAEFKENGFADADFETGMSLEDVIKSLIDNEVKEGYSYKFALSLWAIIAELSKTRPENPLIDYPFFAHYEVDEVLEKHNIFPNLLAVFKSLKGHQLVYELPINMADIGYMPRFVFIKKEQLNTLIDECRQMNSDIESQKKWVSDLEETQDIVQICNWLIEAHTKDLSICLVLDGDT